MDKQLIIELKQKLNEHKTKVSNQQTKVADKKRNVLIAYILIVLGIIATVASGGIGILLFIPIIVCLTGLSLLAALYDTNSEIFRFIGHCEHRYGLRYATLKPFLLSLKLIVYEPEPIIWTLHHAGGTFALYYLPENGLLSTRCQLPLTKHCYRQIL